MGCDIHAYIEVVQKNEDREYVCEIAHIYLGRNYVMFGALASVRVDDVPHIEPKGIPENTDCDDYWLYVSEAYDGEEGYTSVDRADKWVKSGYSTEHPKNTPDHRRISHPDWHSASWMIAEELEKAIENYDAFCAANPSPYGSYGAIDIYRGILAMLKTVPGSRFVFWFDN